MAVDLDGYKLVLAIRVMVSACLREGVVTKVLMHPDDFNDMRQENGLPWEAREICGVPIEIDSSVPAGKVVAVRPKATAH